MPAMPKLPATSTAAALGPYHIIRKLGEGGMGIVYLAHDPDLNRDVAIKQLRPEYAAPDGDLARRFLREARAAARLNHANAVTIYHIATKIAGAPFIVMEYVDGGSLAEHLENQGAMNWHAAAQAVRDAAAGLAAAHDAGIIHRDLKPANLMRTKRGTVKLVDFGLARAGHLDPDLTHPGAFIGSPSYASPEQCALAGCKSDTRSDIYALTCTLFALLTRRPPFVESDSATVMKRHREDSFPDPRSFPGCEELPDGLLRILHTGSQKDPAARFATANQMREALDTLLATPAQSHTHSTPWPGSSGEAGELKQLRAKLHRARDTGDIATQIATLRSMHATFIELGRQSEADDAARRALALHLRTAGPKGRH
jgi:serine/threonine protein kinase